jgi:hypothetical protein
MARTLRRRRGPWCSVFDAPSTAPPLHAAAARAFRSDGRLLRDVLSSHSSLCPPPVPPPAGVGATRCPTSVTSSGEQLRAVGGGAVQPLPCGLALGSHVTVVGAPRRGGETGGGGSICDARVRDRGSIYSILEWAPQVGGGGEIPSTEEMERGF